MDRRLIRLTTHDDRAIFDNSFNQDIQIKPNSKVSLINCTAMIKDNSLVVQGDNRKFSYNLGYPTNATETFDIVLDEAVYGKDNVKDLVADFELKMLQSINPREVTATGNVGTGNNRMIGLTWEVDIAEDNKTQICWTQSKYDEYANEAAPTPERQVLVNAKRYTGQSGLYVREGGTAGTKDSFVSWKQPLQFGGGCFSAKVANYKDRNGGAIANSGLIFCLINKDPTGLTTIANSDIVIAVQPCEENEKYKVWKNGVQSTHASINFEEIVGENASDNVRLEIKYQLGGLVAGIYRADPVGGTSAGLYTQLINLTQTEVNALTDGIQTKLYPCMIFLAENAENTSNPVLAEGDDTFGCINMRNIKYTPLKRTIDKSINSLVSSGSQTILGANNLPSQPSGNRENFIKFGSVELAEYFGYATQRLPPTGTITAMDNLNFIAQNDFKGLLISSQNYIFQLLSHDLDCYDGLSSSRKNILMTMPQVKDTNNLLNFETNTPIPISFKNHSAFSLRNMRARILDYDNQEIAVIGLTNATLLIEG